MRLLILALLPILAACTIAEPPRAEHLAPRPEEPTDHTLAIDAHGALFLDRRPIAAAALAPALAALYPAGTDDRVLFVREGRVEAVGAHADLLARCPPYREITRSLAQAP